MDGFKRDYQRLFELFQSQSRVLTCTPDEDPTEKAADSSTAPSSQLSVPPNCKVYNFTFCQFIQAFQQLKFSAIFCCHRTKNALREFFDEICEYLFEKLSLNQPIEVRIFAFYLLYSLWFIQCKSYKLPFKIRLDRQAYSILQNLINYASKQQQFDIVIAYRALLLAGAFNFCYSIPLYGPYYKDHLKNKQTANLQEIADATTLKIDQEDYFIQLESIGSSVNSIKCNKLFNLLKQFEDNNL